MSDITSEPTRTDTTQPAKEPQWASMVTYPILLVLLIGLIYAAFWGGQPAAPGNADAVRAAAERLQKVGTLDLKIVAATHEPKTGEQVYQAVCSACHATGVTGAPKFGDKADWGPRIATGQQTLEQAPIKGFTGKVGTMPPQGGAAFSDYEIIRAMVYMANAAGANFTEPAAPAEAASAAASQ